MRRAAGSSVALLVLGVGALMFIAGLAVPALLEEPDPAGVRIIEIKDRQAREPAPTPASRKRAERRRRERGRARERRLPAPAPPPPPVRLSPPQPAPVPAAPRGPAPAPAPPQPPPAVDDDGPEAVDGTGEGPEVEEGSDGD